MSSIIIHPHGGAECRICGLRFVPGSQEDEQAHKAEHQSIIRGGLPIDVREFMKTFGWAMAHKDGGLETRPRTFVERGYRNSKACRRIRLVGSCACKWHTR